MVPISLLWLPILLAAVLVFVVSSIIHMVLPYHRSDYAKLPSESEAQEALRRFNIPPGDYMLPHAGGPGGMKRPEFAEMMKKGPVAMLTVFPSGMWNMGQRLGLWFLYCVVVSVIAAYVSGRALGRGADYLTVFRFAGVAAFACYAVALWQASIWYSRKWSTTLKHTFDGLLYALVTGGAFGWLWP